MELKEILEGNKKICEYMGYVQTASDEFFTFFNHPNGKGIVTQESYDFNKLTSHSFMELRGFRFHSSWEWLMQCIGKISNNCENPDELDSLKYSLLCNDIETAWKFVVSYLD